MDEALLSGSPLVKVTISGATGYIGGRLLGTILELGWKACAVVRAGDEAGLPAGVERIVDPGTAGILAGQLTEFGPDVILHLAACQDLTDAPDASDALVEANLAFGARMLSAARTAGARALVAAGTYSVHGAGDPIYDPQTFYAATKQAFSALAGYYRSATDLQTVVLELSDTYGPGDTRRKFLDLVDAAARSGEPLDASPGEQVVSPLHVDDVVNAFVHTALTLLGPEAGTLGAVHSVAGPRAVTLRELVAAYEEVTGRAVPVRWGTRPYRDREIMEPWAGDALPSWSPGVELADGIAAVYGRNPS
jgi:nucleoside-diphosphate-sugar epimerase